MTQPVSNASGGVLIHPHQMRHNARTLIYMIVDDVLPVLVNLIVFSDLSIKGL